MGDSKLLPINYNVPIVQSDGTPSPYFLQWLRQFLDEKALTDEAAATAVPGSRLIIPGAGISGGGALSADVTITADQQAILNGITSTRGALLYRGAALWSALLPGTSGYLLQSGGAGADPSWVAPSGGGGGANWWFNPPTAASFTLASGNANQLTLTNDANAGLLVDCGPMVGGDIQRIAYRTLTTPTGDFDCIVKMSGFIDSVNYSQLLAIVIMDSVGGRIQSIGIGWDGTVTVINWNGLVGFNGGPGSFAPKANMPTWFRLQKVGVNLTYSVSETGKQWTTIYTATATAFLANTPNRVGFGHNYNKTTGPKNLMTIESFSLTGTAV